MARWQQLRQAGVTAEPGYGGWAQKGEEAEEQQKEAKEERGDSVGSPMVELRQFPGNGAGASGADASGAADAGEADGEVVNPMLARGGGSGATAADRQQRGPGVGATSDITDGVAARSSPGQGPLPDL